MMTGRLCDEIDRGADRSIPRGRIPDRHPGSWRRQEAANIREQFDRLEAETGTEKAQVGLVDRRFDTSFIWDLATRPRVLDCVESLQFGPNILLLATHFFCKYGEGTKYVAWHQDATYWALDHRTR